MTATLAALGQRGDGRKVAVLTDMLELGADESRLHAGLAPAIASAGVERVYLAGPLMRALWNALPAALRAGYAATATELLPMVKEGLQGGDIVMIKGSHGSKAGLIAQALLAGE